MAEAQRTCKVVFMGTPQFAADILAQLLDRPGIEVCAVYTQPDKPAGRGNKLVPPAVKVLAAKAGIPVFQPKGLRSVEDQEVLRSFEPDFLVVAAYGVILPQSVLDIPRYEPLNVHTSLLPSYRGCAPVQRAIMDGLEETGVSIMRMEAGLDTGPWFAQERVSCATETTGSLFVKMAEVSGPLLLKVMDDIVAGSAVAHPQEGDGAGYAAKIQKEEGCVDWSGSVRTVYAHIRGVTPDPGAHTVLHLEGRGDVAVVIEETHPDESGEIFSAGTVIAGKKGHLRIACADGCLFISRLKPQGKKSMDAASFLNGQRLGSSQPESVGIAGE